MGNVCTGARAAVNDEPLGKSMLPKADYISAESMPATPLCMKTVTSNIMYPSTIVDGSGSTLYTATARPGLTTLTITVKDASGAVVCVAKGRRRFVSASFKVLRPTPAFAGQPPTDAIKNKNKHAAKELKSGTLLLKEDCDTPLYEFAEGKIKMGPTTASAEYGVLKESTEDKDGKPAYVPIYRANKLCSPFFLFRVETTDGTLIGKAVQQGMCPQKVTAEAGMGADVVAILLLSAFVGAVSGSGGPAIGGLAGAGAI